MSNLKYSASLVPPGEIIKDELKARRLTQKSLAEMMRIPYARLNRIVNAQMPVSPGFALALEATLGISAEMLTNIQKRYDMQTVEQMKKA